MEAQDRVAILQQFGRTYRAFLSAFESHVGQPMPRWRILLALHNDERAPPRRSGWSSWCAPIRAR